MSTLGHVSPRRQLTYELVVDGRLKLEVEVVERLYGGEMRDLDAHGDTFPLLGRDLLVQQAIQKLQVRRLVASCGGKNGIKALGDVAEAEPLQSVDDASVNEIAHCSPPTARS
jgi:hypothetical protein